jgi:hypothetical protein
MSATDLPAERAAYLRWVAHAFERSDSAADDSLREYLDRRYLQGELSGARRCICELLIENQRLRMELSTASDAALHSSM